MVATGPDWPLWERACRPANVCVSLCTCATAYPWLWPAPLFPISLEQVPLDCLLHHHPAPTIDYSEESSTHKSAEQPERGNLTQITSHRNTTILNAHTVRSAQLRFN